jgi:hypothetical protein|tara:strand:- start:851 stop:1087 length:237 start_codon:yes stop_codon:yes gene_type:complete
MNLREIVARLKLKYKIVDGVIYAIIEKGDTMPYPSLRPAFAKEIDEIRLREMLGFYTKEKKKQPVHPPRPPRSPYEEE